MAKAKTKRKRAEQLQLNWRETGTLPSGSRYWQTLDGMFRLVCSEACYGVAIPREWRLWQWKRGSWWPIGEAKSRKRLEKLAVIRNAQLESEDE